MLATLALLLAHANPGAEAVPSDQTVVYFNARMALRDDKPVETVKLWWLRNAIENETELVSAQDDDFRSVTWVALGDLGVCQDGLSLDTNGAGLWPIALHNWLVRNRNGSRSRRRNNPWEAFELERQSRRVSINDVLGSEELATVELSRGACWRKSRVLLSAGMSPLARTSERRVTARALIQLLEKSRDTLSENVVGTSTIEARLFDLHLALIDDARKRARRKQSRAAGRGRSIGLSRPSIEALSDQAGRYELAPSSEPARILTRSVAWPATGWMALSADRRVFLFDQARAFTHQDQALDAVALQLVDRLIEQRQGDEVSRWIARTGPSIDRVQLWSGERGEQLLSLDSDTGFTERSVIGLHRGISALERGDLDTAMQSLAVAIRYADDSRQAEAVRSLSLRWLTYVATQFEVSDVLLDTLKAILSNPEYNVILEDLVWSAAFRADERSFRLAMDSQQGRGALERRIALLDPLVRGNSGQFLTGVRAGLDASPSETLRFLKQFVARLQLEDAQVRESHAPVLDALIDQLGPTASGDLGRRFARQAEDLTDQTQAILEGLGISSTSVLAGRAVDPEAVVYAGSVQLAPVDTIPWPFTASDVSAPSAVVPIQATPVEWRIEGELVFGWALSE